MIDPATLNDPQGTDFFGFDEFLPPRERDARDRLRAFMKDAQPAVNEAWDAAEFPQDLFHRLADLHLAGGVIQGYGCPGLSPLGAGLTALEMSRGDGSLTTAFGVHSGLAMGSIDILGSEEQKQRWLPAMAKMEKIGAFALTEPAHGSDAVALETSARREGDHWVLDGEKRWIGNASFADLVVVWARDREDGQVKGFVVEKGTPGYDAQVITGKVSKRGVWQAAIQLHGVRVPEENRLQGARSFRDTAKVLVATRFAVAWEAIGHAVAAYEVAVAYAKQRIQFGVPLAATQLVQNRLAWMLTEITGMQSICFRLSQLLEEGRLTDAQASLGKMNNARKARAIVADARDLLGGNGVLLDYAVARHQADVEAVITYEGTDTVQSLIIGREITGISAYAPGRPR
ncbi:MAG: acyl-CoA dehydrogenase family protein [Candidatus Dormibacteraceae bacterium]